MMGCEEWQVRCQQTIKVFPTGTRYQNTWDLILKISQIFIKSINFVIMSVIGFKPCDMTRKWHLYIVGFAFLVWGCQKKLTVFELTDQTVVSDQIVKRQHISELKVLQNAYNDLFNRNMPAGMYSQVVSTLNSTNDRAVVVDRVLRHMLNDAELVIQTHADMRADIPAFVELCYNKFYRRSPSPYEKHKLAVYITENEAVTPREVWFAFLTSDEYARK